MTAKNDGYEFALDRQMMSAGRFFIRENQIMIKMAEVTIQRPFESKKQYGDRCKYDSTKLDMALLTGGQMEKTAEELKMINDEVDNSKKILQQSYNEIVAINNELRPILKEEIDIIRSARMTAVSEISQTLIALKDIRKFFLESDYEKEMLRLSEFVSLCKEMKKLKDEGILDALCDSVLKLSIKT